MLSSLGIFSPLNIWGSAAKSKDVRLIMFLRDPVYRLASHYSFWKNGSFQDHYLWRRMIKENWCFERFALSEEMKNFYSQYLSQVSISMFDFIGVHEHLPRDWPRLCSFLGIACHKLPQANSSPNQIVNNLSTDAFESIRNFHADDYLIYDYAIRFSSDVSLL